MIITSGVYLDINLDSTCLFGGDGWCHDLNNVPDCNFDDGDCCLESPVCMIPIMCTECLCHEDQTSHCPGMYMHQIF